MTPQVAIGADARFAPLREELELLPGPVGWDGAPTWTLHDPPTGRFVRLGWMEFQLLLRWRLGTAEAMVDAVAKETTLKPAADHVRRLAFQLQSAKLLRPASPEALAALKQQYTAARNASWASVALKNYLFVRIPLVRPDRFYERNLPRIAWLFSRGFIVATVLAGLFGIILASRQWDSFVPGFPYLTTGEGIVLGILSLLLVKVLHECGHGFMSKRYGCRIRSAGVAFMVFVPMLYTDASDAWRLTDRRARLMIGAAGIMTELMIACWALLFWSFLPDGPIRSVLFFWATTTWVLTVLLNANPFMRFDGYYILSDWLDQPNLQDTSFQLARWHMRRLFLGIEAPIPVQVGRTRRRFLIAFAYIVWIYRLLLFIGIAVLVYYMTFKALGIFLAVVEIGWFILRPIVGELREWWKARDAMSVNPTTLPSGAILVLLLVAAFVPWRSTIHADAMLARLIREGRVGEVGGCGVTD
jgi:putative peptide zinc metalloprotease protein